MTEGKNKWVLLVDDDAVIRQTTADILELRGYRLLCAGSGLETIELLEKRDRDFAVALVDLALPDLDGAKLIEQIKELSPRTQVIMMTGQASVESVITGLRASVIDYLQKPVEMNRLIAAIDRALERRERIEIEDELRKAAIEWRLTFDNIPDIVMIADPELRLTRVNRAARDLFDLPYREILGKFCYQLAFGSDTPLPECLRCEALAEGPVPPFEVYLDRFRRHFFVTVNAIRDEDGKVQGAVHIMHDITERKRMQAQALQAEKLAAVGQLAAGVAHEINNPLAFIMTNLGQLGKYAESYQRAFNGMAEIVEERSDESARSRARSLRRENELDYIDTDLPEMMGETMNGLVRIRNIVADLRKFSSMGEEDVEEVDLNRVAASVANMVKSEIRIRGRLRLQLEPIPTFRGIAGRISQAVLNLVLNAAHALDEAPNPEKQVTVATGRRGEEVFIRVEDNGAGIQPEIMPRLFDPFFTTKKAGEGSGLGLSICQDIALKHRGRIEVKSDPGQGSAFTLLIPLETGLGTRAPEKEAAKTGAAGLNRRPRLLVVDDEKEVLKSLVRVFRDDYFLVTAASAQEALQILETDRRFDLILTDLIMPGLNGKAFFELATGRWPELDPLFVFSTGGAYDASLKEFVAAMHDRTVHKPLGGEEIKTVIRQRLARPDAPAERPRP